MTDRPTQNELILEEWEHAEEPLPRDLLRAGLRKSPPHGNGPHNAPTVTLTCTAHPDWRWTTNIPSMALHYATKHAQDTHTPGDTPR